MIVVIAFGPFLVTLFTSLLRRQNHGLHFSTVYIQYWPGITHHPSAMLLMLHKRYGCRTLSLFLKIGDLWPAPGSHCTVFTSFHRNALSPQGEREHPRLTYLAELSSFSAALANSSAPPHVRASQIYSNVFPTCLWLNVRFQDVVTSWPAHGTKW